MQIIPGAIRLQDLLQSEGIAENTTLKTITSTATNLAVVTIADTLVGDRIFVFGQAEYEKSVGDGKITLKVRRSAGPGVGFFAGTQAELTVSDDFLRQVNFGWLNVGGVYRVGLAGSVTFALDATSDDGDSTCDQARAGLYVLAFRLG